MLQSGLADKGFIHLVIDTGRQDESDLANHSLDSNESPSFIYPNWSVTLVLLADTQGIPPKRLSSTLVKDVIGWELGPQ